MAMSTIWTAMVVISILCGLATGREAEVAAGRLAILDADCPPAQMWSQLVYHRNKWVTPQMEIFLDLMGRRIGPES